MASWREGGGSPEIYRNSLDEMKKFADENFVRLDGWVLAEKEGRPVVKFLYFGASAPFAPEVFVYDGTRVKVVPAPEGLWELIVDGIPKNALVAIHCVVAYLDALELVLGLFGEMVGEYIWKTVIRRSFLR